MPDIRRPHVLGNQALVFAMAGLLVAAVTSGCGSGPANPTGGLQGTAGTSGPGSQGSVGPVSLSIDADQLELLRGPWSPTPYELSADAFAVFDRACRSTYEALQGSYELAVVDARGGAIVNVFYVGLTGGNYGCENLTIDPFGEVLAEGFGTGTDASEPVPQPKPDEVVAWYGTHQEAPRAMLTAAGLVGSNVAEVRLTAEAKPPIVATIMNGWFAAWLPDDWARLTLRGYHADGTEVFSNLDW